MSIIGFAQITYQGRLTDDPEMRTFDNGTTACKFTVAVNRRLPNGEEKTAFIPTTVFGRQAQVCGEFLSRGRTVLVTGEFESDKYTDRNDIKRTGFGCVARDVIFGSGGSKEEAEDKDDTTDFDALDAATKRELAQKYIKGSRGQ